MVFLLQVLLHCFSFLHHACLTCHTYKCSIIVDTAAPWSPQANAQGSVPWIPTPNTRLCSRRAINPYPDISIPMTLLCPHPPNVLPYRFPNPGSRSTSSIQAALLECLRGQDLTTLGHCVWRGKPTILHIQPRRPYHGVGHMLDAR